LSLEGKEKVRAAKQDNLGTPIPIFSISQLSI
jgi:hypothetical protein